MTEATAFWVDAPSSGSLRSEAVPAPRDGELLVRTLRTGISRGTESIVFRGEVPVAERERMRAPFQEGAFPAPVKYGYAAVGEVEAGPPGLQGRMVFCLHPHQDRFCLPAAALVPPEVLWLRVLIVVVVAPRAIFPVEPLPSMMRTLEVAPSAMVPGVRRGTSV